jgi:hypothetical protein
MIPCPTCCRPPRSPGVPCPACGALDRRRSTVALPPEEWEAYVPPSARIDALDPDADVPQ